MNQVQQLYNLAVAANDYATKSAAAFVGGQQVMPSTPYQNAAGLYDPDPSQAGYTALSEARAQINAQTILDGQVSGTNLLPYEPVLNTNYQTVASGMNVQMMGGKQASYQEQAEHFQKMASTGLFHNPNLMPDINGWESINQVAHNKTASIVNDMVMDMINTGVLQQVRPDFVPLFLGQ